MNTLEDTLPHKKGSVVYSLAAYLTKVLAVITRGKFSGSAAEFVPAFPDMQRFVESGGALTEMSLDAQMSLDPAFKNVTVQDHSIPRSSIQISARSYLPQGKPQAAFVWIHGGAFIAGDLNSPETHWFSLVLASKGIAVIALDYRKAVKGAHYPIPFEDCVAGWDWAVANSNELLGVPAEMLQLGGASAGGNLAAAVSKKLRDRADAIQPKSVVLAYPWLHSEAVPWPADELAQLRADAGGLFFEPQDLTDMSHNYAGRKSILQDPYAFPPNGDLRGLPPTFIVNAEFDTIRASGEAYGRSLLEAGNEVQVVTDLGTTHAILASPLNPAARISTQRIADWLLQATYS